MTNGAADVVVVGNGMFGSAATRHLAQRGHRVLNIGAPPVGHDVRTAAEDRWPSHRVYSSHNDAARLTRRQDRNPAWARVTARAVADYRRIERDSGIDFFHDVGCLIVSRPGGDGANPDPVEIMTETDVAHELYEPGSDDWRSRWPEIDFPDTHYVAFEPAPAGFLRPKHMIDAQNRLARQAGAVFVADTVIAVTESGSRFRLSTAGGGSYEASKVLVCAGAFSNFNDLVPASVPVTLKSEVIILGEVAETDANRLARFPTVKYLIDVGDLEAIYMVPPVQYEDGRHYIKIGANTRLDEPIADLAGLQRWFNSETDREYLPLFEPVLRSLWPAIDFVSVRTQPCVITYSADKYPIIEHQGHGRYVATAGNGGGAKGSDAWGELAARMVER